MEYCALCDRDYQRGTFADHRMSYSHKAARAHSQSMAAWYRGNAPVVQSPATRRALAGTLPVKELTGFVDTEDIGSTYSDQQDAL